MSWLWRFATIIRRTFDQNLSKRISFLHSKSMVALPFSTILLLLAPFLVPRALAWLGKYVVGSKPSKSERDTFLRDTHPTPRRRYHSLRLFPIAIVCLYSVAALTVARPFNLFSSLGDIPLNTSTGKLSSTLASQNLSERYSDVLPYLTSLDSRIFYVHFGHDTFLGSQNLLGRPAATDFLIFHVVRLVRTYTLVSILLALGNPRWKVGLGMLASGGVLAEVWILATVEMKFPSTEVAVQSVRQDRLMISRNLS